MRGLENEKIFKKVEKERPDEMEMAEKKNEERKKEEKAEVILNFLNILQGFINI